MLSSLTKSTYEAILISELRPAMGCTEPIAIAYASSILRKTLGVDPTEIKASFSGNIIKNVKSVIVPATGGRHGIEAALAAGIVSCRPDMRLEVLTVLSDDDAEKIDRLLKECKIEISKLNTGCSFELELYGTNGDNEAIVKISGSHTNVTEVSLNGTDITEEYVQRTIVEESGDEPDYTLLNVMDIVEYADTAELDVLRPYLLRQIELNMAIAEEGLNGEWGASIGKVMTPLVNSPMQEILPNMQKKFQMLALNLNTFTTFHQITKTNRPTLKNIFT